MAWLRAWWTGRIRRSIAMSGRDSRRPIGRARSRREHSASARSPGKRSAPGALDAARASGAAFGLTRATWGVASRGGCRTVVARVSEAHPGLWTPRGPRVRHLALPGLYVERRG